jgi:copper chaperone
MGIFKACPIPLGRILVPDVKDAPMTLIYRVDGMSCEHCVVAVTGEVGDVAGVAAVAVDLDTKLVRVSGAGIDHAAVVAAIDEAGYDAVPA